MAEELPKFSDLPLGKSDPPLSAWGLYGPNDQLGTLNRLTEEIVKEASKEIKTGARVSLDWQIDAQPIPFFGRQPFRQDVYNKAPRCVNDDVWTFNTQSSSQWDGLRHYGYQKERRFYNGATLADFALSDPQNSAKTQNANIINTHGIGASAQHGIVGRGILLDWERWREENRAKVVSEVFTEKTRVSLTELKEVAKSQGTEVKFGDVLFVRSGYLKAYKQTPQDQIEPLTKVSPPAFIGVQQSEEVAEWLWNNFAAVAGDHPAFEAFPPEPLSDRVPCILHEVLLAGWGMPIGEMFDLDALSEHCRNTSRYEFFFCSKPCDVPAGVASPPNAIAIF